jgi:3-hydroxyisobutyrate dehydrogenase-like beta-hydroxyacid dehydrogenase
MCLGDDAAVKTAADAMLKEGVKGKVIVDCSTVHPDTTNGLEKSITEHGGEFVGMPGKSGCITTALSQGPS